MKKITYYILFFISFYGFAQVTNQGEPLSWKLYGLNSVAPEIMKGVEIEDTDDTFIKQGKPLRFGQEIAIQLNTQNAGTWDQLSNGDRLWRMSVISENATSLNFIFNDFFIPEGATLYLYNNEKTDLLGAYTHEQNREDGKLGTWFVAGDNVWLEYYEPKYQKGKGRLQIEKVVHGYRSITDITGRGLNDSSPCNYDVNCSIGSDFEEYKSNLKRSVAFFIMGGSICSGTLINNVENNKAPYFLTANHCDNGDISSWAFRFNWVSSNPVCGIEGNSTGNNYNQTISGATKLMTNDKSDVMLVKIHGNLPTNWNLNWAGWNRSPNEIPFYAVTIHHPSGDVMKVSRDNDEPIKMDAPFNGNNQVSLWKIENWEMGVTESGSSGAALFDQNGRIVGQLAGGASQCDNAMADYFGRFDISWDYGDSAETRLSDWLDPYNTGVMTTDGLSNPNFQFEGSVVIFPNPANQVVYINNNNFADLNYQFYTVTGQILQSGQLLQVNNTLSLSSFAQGSYFLKLFDKETGDSIVKRIIVKR